MSSKPIIPEGPGNAKIQAGHFIKVSGFITVQYISAISFIAVVAGLKVASLSLAFFSLGGPIAFGVALIIIGGRLEAYGDHLNQEFKQKISLSSKNAQFANTNPTVDKQNGSNDKEKSEYATDAAAQALNWRHSQLYKSRKYLTGSASKLKLA